MNRLINILRLVRIHLAYLINKNNIIIFLIIQCLFVLIALYKSNILKNINDQILFASFYYESYHYLLNTIFKLIIFLVSTYIFSNLKSISSLLLIKTSKCKFYLSKYIASTLIILILTICYFTIYVSVALGTKWYYFDIILLVELLRILLISLLLGSIAQVLSYLFKSSFSFIVVYFIYIVIDNIDKNNSFSNIIVILFQLSIDSNYDLIMVICQIILYYFVGFYLFRKYETY